MHMAPPRAPLILDGLLEAMSDMAWASGQSLALPKPALASGKLQSLAPVASLQPPAMPFLTAMKMSAQWRASYRPGSDRCFQTPVHLIGTHFPSFR